MQSISRCYGGDPLYKDRLPSVEHGSRPLDSAFGGHFRDHRKKFSAFRTGWLGRRDSNCELAILRLTSIERVDLELDVIRRLKNTCFKGRLEAVFQVKVQRRRESGALENEFRELATSQGAEAGLRALQIPRVFSRQNRN